MSKSGLGGKENGAGGAQDEPSVITQPGGQTMAGAGGQAVPLKTAKQSSLLVGLNQEVDESTLIAESLNSIEAILKAESKRRMEANHITED